MYPRDDFAEMEREDRTAKELATLRAEHDRYREALVEVAKMIEPSVGRFSDGEPINPIGHAYDLIQSALNP